MKTFKKSLLVAACGSLLAAPSAFADGFQLSEKLSVTGFVDMSFVYTDPDAGTSTSTAGLDQFEIDFLYTFDDKLTAQVDLEYDDDPGDPDGEAQEVDIEQAFFKWAYSDELSIVAGRFLSYSGWETQEPTGLFQYSGTGYAKYFYGAYQQGVSAKYSNGTIDLGLTVANDLGNLTGTGTDNRQVATEFMFAITPVEGWTTKAFYMAEGETTLINAWTAYSTGGLTLAAEINSSENAGAAVAIGGVDAEASGYLVMANYAWEKFGLTLRYHESEVETSGGTTVEDLSAITLSPSYTVSDNLLLVFEYRTDDDNLGDTTTDSFAVEALLTF
jgi:hypothetical protein